MASFYALTVELRHYGIYDFIIIIIIIIKLITKIAPLLLQSYAPFRQNVYGRRQMYRMPFDLWRLQ